MRISKPLRAQITAHRNGYGLFAVQRALRALHGSTDGLDIGAYGRFIQHCTDRRLLRQGLQLHGRLVLFSVVPDNFLASKLIAFYSKTHRLQLARKVFDEIPHRNTFSWNAMLIACSVHGWHAEVLRLFSSMADSGHAKPDNFTVTCVMKASAELFSDHGLAREVHCYVLRNGFLDSDVFVGNSLVTCYARCDKPGSARVVFDSMPNRDVVSWNSMLAAYSQAGLYDECKALYKEMLVGSAEKPNSGTLVSVLQACGNSKDLGFGTELHRYLCDESNQIATDIILQNTLVGFYAKCGSLDYALELLEWMKEKDEVTYASMISGYMAYGMVEQAVEFFYRIQNPRVITWNAVISGLVQNNQHDKALDLLREMLVHGSRPNFVTLSAVLPAISHFSHLKGGKEIHAYAYRNSYEVNVYVTTSLIDTYAKSGFLRGSKSVFDQLRNRSLVVWTAIISAYAAHGAAHMSLRLFNKMVSAGIRPDEVTFVAVLTSCAHFGVADEACKIFNSMMSKHRVKPTIEHYTCLVTVLSRAGRLSEALDFIGTMPIEPSAKIWGALLSGASVARDVETGEMAFNLLIKIEPENAGNYVVMANLYAQAKRYQEADMIRERMNRIGLKKVAGSSWIETSDHSSQVLL